MIWPQPFSNSWWQANGDAAVDDDDEDDVTMVVPVESEKPDGELAHLKAVSQSLDRDDVGVSENPVNWPNLYYNMFSEIYLSGLKSQINICQNLYWLFITKLWRNRVHNPSSSWLILGNLIVLKSSNLGVTYGTRWLKWIKNHQKTTSCLAFARFLWCLWSQKGKTRRWERWWGSEDRNVRWQGCCRRASEEDWWVPWSKWSYYLLFIDFRSNSGCIKIITKWQLR